MPEDEETGPEGPASIPLVDGQTDLTNVNSTEGMALDQLEDLASATAGLHFPNDLVMVIHECNAARYRIIQRLRRDARDAVRRTVPASLTDPEIVLQRETSALYARILELEKTRKIRWDTHKSDWVARPMYTTRTDSNRPPAYTEDDLLGHFDKVRRHGKRWSATCPSHDDKHPSLAISEGDRGWLIRCWTGCSFADIVHAVGLESQRMFFS